ncbi:MAG TPA: hypothetical protein PKB14_20045 [Rubrivivax sp.]|nr:hypothetical protein [Rubrivivax sp.]
MRILRRSLPWILWAAAGLAAADGGLKIAAPGGFWSDVQTRLRFNAVIVEPLPRLGAYAATTDRYGHTPLAASLYSDYYFGTKDLADAAGPPSGFRASGALLIRPPGVPLSDVAWSSRATTNLALPRWQPALIDSSSAQTSALPYLGVGYSDYSLKSGWGFWADIGMVVQSPGQALGVGRTLGGSQGVDDLVRELRLSPMLQLGVNYSF